MTSISNEQPGQDLPPDPALDQADPAGGAPPPEPAAVTAPEPQAQAADTPGAINGETSLADDAMTLLSEHKGKLAIGVAATLGLMVYYGWREKRLAQTDPEEYARLQRLRANLRHSDEARKARHARKPAAQADAASQENNAADAADAADPAEAADAAPSIGATQDTGPADARN